MVADQGLKYDNFLLHYTASQWYVLFPLLSCRNEWLEKHPQRIEPVLLHSKGVSMALFFDICIA